MLVFGGVKVRPLVPGTQFLPRFTNINTPQNDQLLDAEIAGNLLPET